MASAEAQAIENGGGFTHFDFHAGVLNAHSMLNLNPSVFQQMTI